MCKKRTLRYKTVVFSRSHVLKAIIRYKESAQYTQTVRIQFPIEHQPAYTGTIFIFYFENNVDLYNSKIKLNIVELFIYC